jgi:hypothetical protein
MPFTGDDHNLPAGSIIPNGTVSDAVTQHNAPFTDVSDALSSLAVRVTGKEPIAFGTVALLFADTTSTYSNFTAGGYIRTRAEGFSFQVAASGASDHHVTFGAAGVVKLYVLPDADGAFNLFAFGAVGDGVTDDRDAILAAIDAANASFSFAVVGVGGAKIVTMPGADHAYSGRIRMRPGVTIDIGVGSSGGRLTALDTTGGIEQVGASGLRANLRTSNASYTGPMLELADANSTELGFGFHDRQAWFDVVLRGARQTGSRGLILHSTTANGVSWVQGTATISEIDYPFDLHGDGATAYVTENWLDIRIYDGIEYARLIDTSSLGVSSNRIKLTTQTGANSRSGRALECQGTQNTIDIKVWDWATSKLDPAYDGTQILFTENSGGNILTGSVQRPLTDRQPAIIDLAPMVRKNRIYANDQRYQTPLNEFIIPQSYLNVTPVADMHDELAYGYYRWRNAVVAGASVTGSGATPPTTTDLKAIFQPDANQLAINSATEAIITVDFGSTKAGGDFSTIAVAFNGSTTKPDKCKVEFSTDGVAWTTQVSCGYNGEPMPHVLYRCDGAGLSDFRYAKLTMENNSAKNLRVARWSILGHGITVTQGAYGKLVNPQFHGSIDIQREFGGEGLKIDATKVVGPRDTGWATGTGTALKGAFAAYAGATHTGAYVQATIQALDDAAKNASQRVLALEAMLRTHGLIN